MSRLGKSWWWQWCADLLKQVFCNLEQRRKWPSIQLQTHNLPRSSPPPSSISSWSPLTLALTQIWEIRGLPSLACDLHHLRRHHPLFSWMAALQNTVRLLDYHDFFLMMFTICLWSVSLILSRRRGCYVLQCSGMQLTSFGFRQHRSSKVTKPGKMSTLPRTPGLQFYKLL